MTHPLSKCLRLAAGGAPIVAFMIHGALFAAQAAATTLTFDGSICGPSGSSACVNGAQIGTDYGSIPGQLDVVFASRDATPNGAVLDTHVRFWGPDFGDLVNVAFAANAPPTGGPAPAGAIALMPKPGFKVTLNSFDLAGWHNVFGSQSVSYGSQFGVYDAAFNALFSSGPISVSDTGHAHFTPGITRTDGIILRWGPDGFNVGIDNIDFTVSAVPEPSAFAMIAVGLGLVGLRLHSRRKG